MRGNKLICCIYKTSTMEVSFLQTFGVRCHFMKYAKKKKMVNLDFPIITYYSLWRDGDAALMFSAKEDVVLMWNGLQFICYIYKSGTIVSWNIWGESIISLNVWWREMPFHKISMEVDLIFNIYIYITLKKRKLYVTNQIHCCGPCGPVEAYCQNSGRNFF